MSTTRPAHGEATALEAVQSMPAERLSLRFLRGAPLLIQELFLPAMGRI